MNKGVTSKAPFFISFIIVFTGVVFVTLFLVKKETPLALGQSDFSNVPDIPYSFFEAGKEKIWIEVAYNPEETRLRRGDRDNYFEDACIHLKAWQAHIDESGTRQVIPATTYTGEIEVADISRPKAIYDGFNGASKRYLKFNNWLWGEMDVCLASLHYRYAKQKKADVKILSRDRNTNLYIYSNLYPYQNDTVLEIEQWVDYRAIVKRNDRYRLVWKAYLYVKLGGLVEDYVMPNDKIVCDSGADWFKGNLVDALNKDTNTFSKIKTIEISYEKGSPNWYAIFLAQTDSETRVTFFIAKPVKSAKLYRLNLSSTSGYNYKHTFTRTPVIQHEATHAYHNWAMTRKNESGIKDNDNDELPFYQDALGKIWNWQADDREENGFWGDSKTDLALVRPQAITKSLVVEPNDKNDWYYFRKLILDNMPKEPVVGHGEVPNGKIDRKVAVLTFYWPEDSSPSLEEKQELKSQLEPHNIIGEVEFGEGSITLNMILRLDYSSILRKILPVVNYLEIKYRIKTPHHPEEYDCEETAGGTYVGFNLLKKFLGK